MKKVILFLSMLAMVMFFAACAQEKTEQPQEKTYTVSVAASPAEGGTVSGGGNYKENTEVTVVATPNEGYKFVAWKEGDEEKSTMPSYKFKVSENVTLTAAFEAVEEKLPASITLAAKTVEYTGSGIAVDAPVTQPEGLIVTCFYTGVEGTDYPESYELPVNAGKYKVVAKFPGNAQYAACESEPVILTIDQAESIITMEEEFTAYETGKPIEMAVSVNFGLDIAVTYEGIDGTEYAKSEDAPSQIGSYKVVASCEGNANVKASVKEGKLIIVAPPEVKAEDEFDSQNDWKNDSPDILNVLNEGGKMKLSLNSKPAADNFPTVSKTFKINVDKFPVLGVDFTYLDRGDGNGQVAIKGVYNGVEKVLTGAEEVLWDVATVGRHVKTWYVNIKELFGAESVIDFTVKIILYNGANAKAEFGFVKSFESIPTDIAINETFDYDNDWIADPASSIKAINEDGKMVISTTSKEGYPSVKKTFAVNISAFRYLKISFEDLYRGDEGDNEGCAAIVGSINGSLTEIDLSDVGGDGTLWDQPHVKTYFVDLQEKFPGQTGVVYLTIKIKLWNSTSTTATFGEIVSLSELPA